MVIPKHYFNAIVSISTEDNRVIGTGFMVLKRKNEKTGWLYLVTNKHVIENQKKILIEFTEKDNKKTKRVEVELYKNGIMNYSVHPKKNIDIAAIHINGQYLKAYNMTTDYFDIYDAALSTKEMEDNALGEGTFIYSLGYPLGLADKEIKKPICRFGCIARMYIEKESDNILLDIQNFPGNSGSPVINRPEMMSFEKGKSFLQSKLIGILHSYIPYKTQLVNLQTNSIEEIRAENSGLAYMHPVEFIREVIEIEYQKKNAMYND